jgi:signal transduction histidine kinase
MTIFKKGSSGQEILGAIASSLLERSAAIDGRLPLLRAGLNEDSPEIAVLAEIEDSARALCELAEEFAEFAEEEVRSAREGPLTVPVSPRDILRRVLAVVGEGARARHIMISDRLPAELPQVEASVERLHLALVHVLRSVVRFSPEGAVITLQGAVEGNLLRVEIWSDGGPGVPAAELENPKSGSGRALARPAPRSGLGLRVARHIIREHAGDLRLLFPARPGAGGLVVVLPTMKKATSPEAGAPVKELSLESGPH